jgi:hypothetical protein
MIPVIRVQNRLRVFIAMNKAGINAQINILSILMSIMPRGARTLKAVRAPNTAGAT